MKKSTNRQEGAGAERVATWGTYALCVLACWTSFTHLADVAARSGVPTSQAWVWPTMIDGAAVIATLAATSAAGYQGQRRYAWGVVWTNLGLSLAGNIISVLASTGPMPLEVRVVVACIPPVELMVCLHLALIRLARRRGAVAPVERPAPHREPVHAPVHVEAVHGPVHDVVVERATPVDVERAPIHPVPAAPPVLDAPLFDVAAAEASGAVRVTATVPDDEREPGREPAGDEARRVERFTEWVRTVRAVHGPDRPTWAEAGEYLGASKATGGRWLAKHGAPDQSADAAPGGLLVDEGQDDADAVVVSGVYERIGA